MQTEAHLKPIRPLSKNLFLGSLLLLTVFAVSRVHAYFGILRVMRPAVLLVVFAAGYALFKPQVLRMKNLKEAWPAKLVIIIFMLSCCSVVFGISPGRAGRFVLEDYWKTQLFGFLLVLSLRRSVDVHRLAWAVVIAAGCLAWLSLFVFGISKTQGSYGYDANDIGVVMVTALPLTIYPLQVNRGWKRLLSLAVLVLAAETVAMSQSRGAFLGLLGVGLGLLLFARGVAFGKRVLVLVVVGAALALSAPPGYWKLISSLQNPQEDYNWSATNGRKALVLRGIHYMLTYPVFGIGINNFPMAEGTISEKAKDHVAGTGVRWAAAHNSYIQMGAEMGIPGLLCWFALLLGGMAACVLAGLKMPDQWARGSPEQRYMYYLSQYVPVSLMGFMISSFFVSFAYHDLVFVLVSLLSGLLVCTNLELTRPIEGTALPVPMRMRRQRGGGWDPQAQPLVFPSMMRASDPRITGGS